MTPQRSQLLMVRFLFALWLLILVCCAPAAIVDVAQDVAAEPGPPTETTPPEGFRTMHVVRVVPTEAGNMVLLATESGGMVCLGAGPEIQWKTPLDGKTPAGEPLLIDGQLIVALTDGTVLRLAADSGEETARIDLGEPVTGRVVALGTRLLLLASDGSLLVAELPE